MKSDNNGELWLLIQKIPSGMLVSYGALGRALKNPLSGFEVGRKMAHAPGELPWWRVVAKDGRLPIHKRDPELAKRQTILLKKEKIKVLEGIAIGQFWDPE